MTRQRNAMRISVPESWHNRMLLPVLDGLTIFFCFIITCMANVSCFPTAEDHGFLIIAIASGCLIFFTLMGHYDRRRQFWPETGDIVAAALVAMSIDVGLRSQFMDDTSGTSSVFNWGLLAVSVPMARFCAKRISFTFGCWKRSVVICGSGPLALEAADAYASDRHLGYNVVGFIDPGAPAWSKRDLIIRKKILPVYPLDPEGRILPVELKLMHIVVALEARDLSVLDHLIEELGPDHRNLDIISPIRGLPIRNAHAWFFVNHDFLLVRVHGISKRTIGIMMKRLLDLIMAGSIFIFLAPLVTLTALLLWREGAPIIVAETKIGRNGRLFKRLKFRSVVPDAAEVLNDFVLSDRFVKAERTRDQKRCLDPKVTTLGHYLQISSLDQVPQLWNVIKGEMSFVGPYPVAPNELLLYGSCKDYYLKVRPGITGLWKFSERLDLDTGARASLESWYVRNWSLWYDIFILCKTAVTPHAEIRLHMGGTW